MNKPSDPRVREAVESIFNVQPFEPGLAQIDATLKSRTLLHQWPLSRVERLVFRSAELPNLILKTVLPPLKSELGVYTDVFTTDRRWTATLYGNLEVENQLWLLLEDVGNRTLKKEPSLENLNQAIATLASLHVAFSREVASGALQKRSRLALMDYPAYMEGARDALNLTQLLVNRGKYPSIEPRQLSKLEGVVNMYDRVALTLVSAPQSLVHGDFTAENIAFHSEDGRVVILDWANSFVGASYLDLVDLSTFATTIYGSEIMPRVLQTYRMAYRAASGEPVPTEPLEEIFVCAQIEKKMSLIRWFNLCGLRYIPTGVAAYNNSVAGLIEDVYELSTVLT